MLDPVRARARMGHTGSWQGFRTSIERFPESGLSVIVLANSADAEPRSIALGVAGVLEPSLVPPHRLTAPLPGDMPPVPVDSVLRSLADDSASGLFTPGLRRFLSPAERGDWRELSEGVTQWTALGCDPASAPVERLGARIARWCYARGQGPDGGVVVTLSYTSDWRLADADSYRY
jgi:hypothetical protein